MLDWETVEPSHRFKLVGVERFSKIKEGSKSRHRRKIRVMIRPVSLPMTNKDARNLVQWELEEVQTFLAVSQTQGVGRMRWTRNIHHGRAQPRQRNPSQARSTAVPKKICGAHEINHGQEIQLLQRKYAAPIRSTISSRRTVSNQSMYR